LFHLHDAVLYGTDGICRITDIARRRFGKDEREYYILTPIHQERSVIYVPTDNALLLSKMHPVLSADQIEALLSCVADEALQPWTADDNRRREQWRQILLSGDRHSLLRMIRSIYCHSQEQKQHGRKLHQLDEAAMKEAEELLYGEFSFVLHIPCDEVLPYLIERLGPVHETA